MVCFSIIIITHLLLASKLFRFSLSSGLSSARSSGSAEGSETLAQYTLYNIQTTPTPAPPLTSWAAAPCCPRPLSSPPGGWRPAPRGPPRQTRTPDNHQIRSLLQLHIDLTAVCGTYLEGSLWFLNFHESIVLVRWVKGCLDI